MLRLTVHTKGLESIKEKLAESCTKAEHTVALQIREDTRPYVPALTGSLDTRTRIEGFSNAGLGPGTGGSTIVYPGPYARYLYYGKVMVDAATGKGPMRIVGEDGPEVIRFRKGAKLKPTDMDLNIQRSVNPKAQSHWFEASRSENLEKWVRVADKAVKNDL